MCILLACIYGGAVSYTGTENYSMNEHLVGLLCIDMHSTIRAIFLVIVNIAHNMAVYVSGF